MNPLIYKQKGNGHSVYYRIIILVVVCSDKLTTQDMRNLIIYCPEDCEYYGIITDVPRTRPTLQII